MTHGDHGAGTAAADELLELLARERTLLENLVFRLIEARGLLATGEARFLGWAATDVEAAAEAVREAEMRRATAVGAVGGTYLPTMAVLIDTSREPYASLFGDHRLALGRLLVEVGAALESAHDLAAAGLASVRAAGLRDLCDLEPPALAGPEPTGDWDGVDRRRRGQHPRRSAPFAELDELDREIIASGFAAVLNATRRITLPSLVAFLS